MEMEHLPCLMYVTRSALNWYLHDILKTRAMTKHEIGLCFIHSSHI